MPYKSLEINPVQISEQNIARTSQIYRGYSTIDNNKSSTKIYDFDLIRQNLLNQFNTRQGERVMDPEFGSVIWEMLYEPFTDSTKSIITSDVDRILASDPRVVPLEVNLIERDFGIIIEATIQVINTNQTENLTLQFDKSIGLVE
jgi:phage baseplate assembly protein W